MSIEDPLVDGRITRRQALIGAGTAALGVSLFGPTSFKGLSPFGPATAGAATGGSPFVHLLRPASNLDSAYATLPAFPNQAYIESFIHAGTGLTSTGGGQSHANLIAKYGTKWFAYVKAGSVHQREVGGDPGHWMYGTDPLVLKDSVWNRPIVGPVTYDEYMPDLTAKAYRDLVVAVCQRAISQGHKGIWLDNVLNPISSYSARSQQTGYPLTMLGKPYEGPGQYNGQVPMPKRANGTIISFQEWNLASAQLMTELRTALGPDVPILSNVQFYAPWDEGDGYGGNFSNAAFVTVAQKSTYLNREGWVHWGSNYTAGDWMEYSLGIIDGARAAVPGVKFVYDTFPGTASNLTGREYALAAAYLVSNGSDLFGDNTYYGTDDWVGYHVELGAPSGARTAIPGASYAWQRTFAKGLVLFNAGTGTPNVTLPAGVSYWKLDGTTVSGSVSLPPNRGLILHNVTTGSALTTFAGATSIPATLNLSTQPSTTPRAWRKFHSASPTSTTGNAVRNVLPVLLPTWTQLGTGTNTTAASTGTTFSWSDATGTASGSTNLGVAVSGNGNGWQLTFPGYKAEPRLIKLYVGVRGAGAVLRVAAQWSGGGGGQATTYTGGTDTTTLDQTITIAVAPAKPTGNLTLKITQDAGPTAAARVVLYGIQVL